MKKIEGFFIWVTETKIICALVLIPITVFIHYLIFKNTISREFGLEISFGQAWKLTGYYYWIYVMYQIFKIIK